MNSNNKIELERFIVNMPDKIINKIELLAREKGCTMSWLYRAVFFALEKKFHRGLPEDLDICRPTQFIEDFRQATVCFYGDKKKWMSLSRIYLRFATRLSFQSSGQVELGPLLRYGLKLYFNGKLELDFESPKTVKEIKIALKGKNKRKRSGRGGKRYIYQYLAETFVFGKDEFRPKNPRKNIQLMEMGLTNRKTLLRC